MFAEINDEFQVMDIELIKTFLEVKNTRHFGKAADNLYITQAAVSARIKQLEESFGVQLFIRKRNNLQLTSEGDRLVSHAETMLLAWNRARQEVALKVEQKDQLVIGATAGLWNYVYQNKLAKIYEAFPTLALRSEVHNADDLLRMVLERALDVAVLFDAPAVPELTVHSAGKLKLVLASTLPEIGSKQAFNENYIYVDWGTAFNMFHAKRFKEETPSILHTTMASIALAFMQECPSSAFLPATMVESSELNNLKIIEGVPTFSREISIIYRSSSERLDLISQLLPALQV